MSSAPPHFTVIPDDSYFSLEHSGQSGRSRLVVLAPDDPYYHLVRDKFIEGWRHADRPRPPVRAVLKILSTNESLNVYKKYRAKVAAEINDRKAKNQGNQKLLFHGTNRYCRVAENPDKVRICELSECSLCSIIRHSFNIEKSGNKHSFRRFGKGIYTTTCSSKADDYSFTGAKKFNWRVMLACRVVVGRPLIRRQDDTELTAPPPGYHSAMFQVIGKPGENLNYHETVVYDDDAIRPAFVVVYGEKQQEESSCVVC
ncbi:putative poly(ADP-ribose) polymerase catalytic domain [Lyophyllum shimeji]|uniref:Poly [ADP-ribose] polymerase n=1 Tax=Lyophyllum shimeji TaxID=47721 RepID=A0A9P3UPJ1_LYOSH|nr:putative poly(ADP-ribose) polymerase catalytic domain [Lyophyllum shimeji]